MTDFVQSAYNLVVRYNVMSVVVYHVPFLIIFFQHKSKTFNVHPSIKEEIGAPSRVEECKRITGGKMIEGHNNNATSMELKEMMMRKISNIY